MCINYDFQLGLKVARLRKILKVQEICAPMISKFLVLIFILIVIFIVGCSQYSYVPPKDKSCDYSNKNLCTSKGCVWHLLDDIQRIPMPATCCSKEMYENLSNMKYDKQDPCTIIPG